MFGVSGFRGLGVWGFGGLGFWGFGVRGFGVWGGFGVLRDDVLSAFNGLYPNSPIEPPRTLRGYKK